MPSTHTLVLTSQGRKISALSAAHWRHDTETCAWESKPRGLRPGCAAEQRQWTLRQAWGPAAAYQPRRHSTASGSRSGPQHMAQETSRATARGRAQLRGRGRPLSRQAMAPAATAVAMSREHRQAQLPGPGAAVMAPMSRRRRRALHHGHRAPSKAPMVAEPKQPGGTTAAGATVPAPAASTPPVLMRPQMATRAAVTLQLDSSGRQDPGLS